MRISTSPGPGVGTGRRPGTNASGPPGSGVSITVISAGNALAISVHSG